MNTAILSSSGHFAGIGFAVPVDTINRVVPRLIAQGRYVRPTLGVLSDDDVSTRLLKGTGVSGVLVLQVLGGSAAARAGLLAADVSPDGTLIARDVIVAVDGAAVSSVDALIQVLDQHGVGDAVTLGIYRGGRVIEVQVVLGAGTE